MSMTVHDLQFHFLNPRTFKLLRAMRVSTTPSPPDVAEYRRSQTLTESAVPTSRTNYIPIFNRASSIRFWRLGIRSSL